MTSQIKAQLWQCHSLWAKHHGLVCWTDRKVLSCCNTGKWKHFAERNVWTDWNCVFGIIFWRWTAQPALNSLTVFSSVAGLGNEVKLKLRLPPFSLIHIQCQHVYFFSPVSLCSTFCKCCYTLTIWLGALGCSNPIGNVNCQLLFCQLLVNLSLISLPKHAISVSVCCSHQFRFLKINTIPWKNIRAKFYSWIRCYWLSGTRVKVDACFCADCFVLLQQPVYVHFLILPLRRKVHMTNFVHW